MQFQFLIGRLKTESREKTQLFIAKFQFLIGRLKTGAGIFEGGREHPFQFLIGRLKTEGAENTIPSALSFNSL